MFRGYVLAPFVVICVVSLNAGFSDAQSDVPDIPSTCPTCNEGLCPPFNSSACAHGVVTDRCRCCFTCARGPGELCSTKRVTKGFYHGQCGSGMACRKRKDVDESYGDEWLCYCLSNREVCGGNGVSYDNTCQLNAASKKFGRTIIIKHYGVCRQAPVIVSPPEHSTESVGSWITLSCEARGFPIPTVKWVYKHSSIRKSLPGGDMRIAVNSRGGPGKYDTTGYLQIMNLAHKHEGDYICIASNLEGETNTSARLFVSGEKEVKMPVRPSGPVRVVAPPEALHGLQMEHRPQSAATQAKPTIDYINSLHYEKFVDLFGNVIDNCNLCASAVWGLRPFGDSKDLQIKMTTFLDSLPDYGQEGILRGFPGLRALTEPEFGWSKTEEETLVAADDRYRRRFGFPLIVGSKPPVTFATLLDEANRRLRMGLMHELKYNLETVKNITITRICEMLDGDSENSRDVV